MYGIRKALSIDSSLTRWLLKDERGRVMRSVKGKDGNIFLGALFQDRPKALCLERGSRDNVGGGRSVVGRHQRGERGDGLEDRQ